MTTLEQQESISVGYVLPTCQPYMLQPPDVSTAGEGHQVNKFLQVSSVGYQMSLARGQGWGRGGPMSDVHGGQGVRGPVQ